MSANLVLINGHIHTVDANQPQATAVAIRNGQILAVGQDDDIKNLLDSKGKCIDLEGKTVTPGLVDAHVHFHGYTLSLEHLNLDGITTLQETLKQVARYIVKMPAGKWLLGRGWSQGAWTDADFPTAADLDRIAPHLPVLLIHKSGHAAWINTKAMQITGITADTVDPAGGSIQRNERGEPTGILLEDAIDLVDKHVPPVTPHDLAESMRYAQQKCWQAGLVGLHDFDGSTCFRALQILQDKQELGLRIVKNIRVRYLNEAIDLGLRTGFGSDWLRIGGVKIFADGALGPRTALMFDPYENEPNNRGMAVVAPETMLTYVDKASLNGLSSTIHAIGDKANHDVLNVFTAVRVNEVMRVKEQTGVESAVMLDPKRFTLRHRIEHVQILHSADIGRLAQLGIIASMQPIHATSDMQMADAYWGKRAQHSYAWQSLRKQHTLLAFGSDAPIEPIDPLLGIYAAVNRRRPDGTHAPRGWYPEQGLSLADAIRGFTWGSAYAGNQEYRTGTITAGKLADFTIFDSNIFEIENEALAEVQIAGTIVNGQFKYRNF